jgi:uncharacterized cupin superfamily protein
MLPRLMHGMTGHVRMDAHAASVIENSAGGKFLFFRHGFTNVWAINIPLLSYKKKAYLITCAFRL